MRDVTMVTMAHTQRFWRMGERKRSVMMKPRAVVAKETQRAQFIGSLYGIGMGVCFEMWAASGPASNPLYKWSTDVNAAKRLTHTRRSHILTVMFFHSRAHERPPLEGRRKQRGLKLGQAA